MTRIFSPIDYDKTGKQVDWLYVPHSVTRSAYGNLLIPICVVKNGSGPTVLLTAGTHGDEFEGQVVLTNFIREVDPAQVQGRLIILPALNTPAALDSARVSPVDQGNLARLFPGHENGTITQQIADYVTRVLFPMADFYQDYHSGGSSLDYLPFVHTVAPQDPAKRKAVLAALRAVNPPRALFNETELDNRTSLAAAKAAGLVALAGEFGGMGNVALEGVRIVERTMRRLLGHAQVMEVPAPFAQDEPSRELSITGGKHHVYSTESGLFEPYCELGDEVQAGQACGRIIFPENPARQPIELHFKSPGLLVCKRHFARVQPGDCVAHLAEDTVFKA